ncbi:MAG TPA: hypothetical protein PKH44_09875 [Plasticicumulans sp.]|nr:hypothetical protein [Plasticicumulans sp.]
MPTLPRLAAAALCCATLATGCALPPGGYPQGSAVPAWKIVGLGTSTCAGFSATARGSVERDAYRQWLLGYLSAYNVGSPTTADVIDARHLRWTDLAKPQNWEEWLEDWCRTQPGAPFQTAAQMVVMREYNEMLKQDARENSRDRR